MRSVLSGINIFNKAKKISQTEALSSTTERCKFKHLSRVWVDSTIVDNFTTRRRIVGKAIFICSSANDYALIKFKRRLYYVKCKFLTQEK